MACARAAVDALTPTAVGAESACARADAAALARAQGARNRRLWRSRAAFAFVTRLRGQPQARGSRGARIPQCASLQTPEARALFAHKIRDREHELRDIERLGQVRLIASHQCALSILRSGERGERQGRDSRLSGLARP